MSGFEGDPDGARVDAALGLQFLHRQVHKPRDISRFCLGAAFRGGCAMRGHLLPQEGPTALSYRHHALSWLHGGAPLRTGVRLSLFGDGLDGCRPFRSLRLPQSLHRSRGGPLFPQGRQVDIAQVTGLVLAFAGIVLVFYGRPTEAKPTMWIGDLLEIVAAFLWAATTPFTSRDIWRNECTLYKHLPLPTGLLRPRPLRRKPPFGAPLGP